MAIARVYAVASLVQVHPTGTHFGKTPKRRNAVTISVFTASAVILGTVSTTLAFAHQIGF